MCLLFVFDVFVGCVMFVCTFLLFVVCVFGLFVAVLFGSCVCLYVYV